MTKIVTDKKAKRLERNAKIKEKYELEMKKQGAMSSVIVFNIAKSFDLTPQTVYSIIR